MPLLPPDHVLRRAADSLPLLPQAGRFDASSAQILAYDRPSPAGPIALVAFVQQPLFPVSTHAVLVLQVNLASGEIAIVRAPREGPPEAVGA